MVNDVITSWTSTWIASSNWWIRSSNLFIFNNIISFFGKYHTSFIDCYSSSSFFFSEFKLLLILLNQSIVDIIRLVPNPDEVKILSTINWFKRINRSLNSLKKKKKMSNSLWKRYDTCQKKRWYYERGMSLKIRWVTIKKRLQNFEGIQN